MKLRNLSIILGIAAWVLTGCETPYGTPDRTGTGALAGGGIGAASGALIGGASGHAGEGALIGGALGAITGGLIGHSMDVEEQARLREQAPQTYVRVEQGQPLSVADVKALSQARLSDDVIISQIRNSHTVGAKSRGALRSQHMDEILSGILAIADPPESHEVLLVRGRPRINWRLRT